MNKSWENILPFLKNAALPRDREETPKVVYFTPNYLEKDIFLLNLGYLVCQGADFLNFFFYLFFLFIFYLFFIIFSQFLTLMISQFWTKISQKLRMVAFGFSFITDGKC